MPGRFNPHTCQHEWLPPECIHELLRPLVRWLSCVSNADPVDPKAVPPEKVAELLQKPIASAGGELAFLDTAV